MAEVHVYLNFDGTTESAFKFYKSVFGGEFHMLQRYKESPGMPPMSPADGEKLIHVDLPITKNLVLHGSDSVDGMGPKLVVGNNVSLMLQAASKEEADRYFKLLSAGGKIGMPLADAFWGDYYGAFTDKFGVEWMIDYEYPKK